MWPFWLSPDPMDECEEAGECTPDESNPSYCGVCGNEIWPEDEDWNALVRFVNGEQRTAPS